MIAAEKPLSKESFGNNADLLVYPDRHEYRTRSRLGSFMGGAFCIFSVAFLVWTCVGLIRDSVDWSDRILGYGLTAIFSPGLVLFLLIAVACFRSNPWIVITPAGIEFHNRLTKMGLRVENFLVEFPDIEDIETKRFAEKGGRFQIEPTSFRYALKIHTEDRGALRLSWNTFNRDEAARFENAFLESMKEMAARALGLR